jgi:D-3-phosphoglycerate dehydrogenase / 2-oxoglutarate reductase
MPTVLVGPSTLAKGQGEWLELLKRSGFTVKFSTVPRQMVESELMEALDGVDAALAGGEPYNRRVLERHRNLKVVARVGVGYDSVDVVAASERAVPVTITPGANHDAVAEHTFAMMLALAKDLVPRHIAVAAGEWPRRPTLPLRGRVLGIAGLGRIGRAVAVRGYCFGMKLLAHEPMPDNAFVAKYDVKLVSLDELLTQSDFLSLHIPLDASSRGMINRNTLAKMKPTSFLINTARGALVNEADLYEALMNKTIAGAGLDVFEKEPPAKENPLLKLPNVVLAPHAAGVDVQSLQDMALSAARSIVALSRNEWPGEAVVNGEIRELFSWR